VDDDALRGEISDLLLRFIAGVVLFSNEVAKQVGLGPSDSQFLGLLSLEGPLTPGRLAELTGLTTGTVTGVLDRLERGGFVRRERDAADRRKVVVTPVPEGVARLAAHYSGHGTYTDALLARRDTAQLRVLRDFLREMNASPGTLSDAGTEAGRRGDRPDAAGAG
jgi:DNA-binding MarR family transcriptional regulator